MSILMDAIKKAEEARAIPDELPLELEEKAAPPVDAKLPFDDRAAAERLFAVKSTWRDRHGLWILAAAAALLLIGALYYGYLTQENPKSVPQLISIAPPLPLPQETPHGISDAAAVGEARPSPEKREAPVNTVRIQKNPVKAAVNPLSVQGYQAMMAKDLDGAQKNYSRLLDRDPQNKEALLGLAAIALGRGRTALAERYYNRVLEIDPENPVASASLVDIGNPPDGESRLKALLRNFPDSGALYFSLGNQYASQSLWADAQQAYFDAYRSAQDNPDFAFNLAVSLDHLSQYKLAFEYYRRALRLSGKGFPGFDPAAVELRMHELEK